ncbi:MAG TPA: hypothetical protein DCR97_03675 [Deltaproteobacteria bacterium]|nr:hypothetical protein [Deltaproteobacteria bacterium]
MAHQERERAWQRDGIGKAGRRNGYGGTQNDEIKTATGSIGLGPQLDRYRNQRHRNQGGS